MTTRTWIRGAVVAIGLAVAGCGAAEEDVDEAPSPPAEEVVDTPDQATPQAAPAAPMAPDGMDDDLAEEEAAGEGEGAFDMEE